VGSGREVDANKGKEMGWGLEPKIIKVWEGGHMNNEKGVG
jgi:hypothetical protein